MIKQIWDFRYFIWSSVKSELRLRRNRSRLGLFWMFIHPLFQAGLMILVLSGVMSDKMSAMGKSTNYAAFVLSGTLAWSLFNEVISRTLYIFVENAQLMKKTNFPKIVLPINVVIFATLNNLFLFLSVLFLYGLVFHIYPNINYLALPMVLILNALLAFFIGLIISTLNTFVRDFAQFTPMGLMLVYWGSPIVYHRELLPDWLQIIQNWNPFYYVVETYHSILISGEFPQWDHLAIILVSILSFGFFGLIIFRKADCEMVDIL